MSTLDWRNGYLWRAADEAGNVILNPLSWRENTGIEFLRRGTAAQALREPLLAEEAAEAGLLAGEGATAGVAETLGLAGGVGLASAEGAEVGMFGGPVGALVGAGLGAAAGVALAFRGRNAPEREDHFLDARSVNGANESARPLRSRFDQALDQRQRNPQPLRPRLERHNFPGSEEEAFYRMDAPSAPPWRRDDEAPGRQQDVLRPTAAARPQEQRRSAQDVVNAIAAAQPRAPEQLRIPRVPGDRNRAPPPSSSSSSGGQPAGSSQDIMRPTSAPMASSYGLNPAPPLPALPPARRRNKGPPVAAS